MPVAKVSVEAMNVEKEDRVARLLPGLNLVRVREIAVSAGRMTRSISLASALVSPPRIRLMFQLLRSGVSW